MIGAVPFALALAFVYLNRREYDKAEASFERALALNDNDADTLVDGSQLLIYLNKPDEAVAVIESVMEAPVAETVDNAETQAELPQERSTSPVAGVSGRAAQAPQVFDAPANQKVPTLAELAGPENIEQAPPVDPLTEEPPAQDVAAREPSRSGGDAFVASVETSPAAVELLSSLVGRPRLPPRWAWRGAIIGMQGGTEMVLRNYTALKALGCPMSAFWLQDWTGPRPLDLRQGLWDGNRPCAAREEAHECEGLPLPGVW